MPNMAPITIKDGASTPADHVFSPASVNGEAASFQDLSPATVMGRDKLSVVSRGASGGNSQRITIRLSRPVTVTATDPNTGKVSTVVDREYLGVVDLYVPKAGTTQERKDLRTLIANALLNASVGGVVDNIEWYY